MTIPEELSRERGPGWQFKNHSASPELKETAPPAEDAAQLPAKLEPGDDFVRPDLFGHSASITPTSYDKYFNVSAAPRAYAHQPPASSTSNKFSILMGILFVVFLFSFHFLSAASHGSPFFVFGTLFFGLVLNFFHRRMKMMSNANLKAAAKRRQKAASLFILIFCVPLVGFGLAFLLYGFAISATFGKADSLYRKGQYQQSIESFNSARIVPGIPGQVIDVHIGNCYFQMSQYDQALISFNKALSQDHENVYAHIGLADTYYEMGNCKKAVEEYTTSIGFKPRDAELYSFRADTYELLGKKSLAAKDRMMAKQLKARYR